MNIHDVMTVSEIIEQVNVSERTVRDKCQEWEQQNKARRAGGVWIVDRATAEEYIKQNPKTQC